MKNNLRFIAEPLDSVYRSLLQFAGRHAATFYFVVRDQKHLTDGAQERLTVLEPGLLSVGDVAEWPGTQLLGRGVARLFSYGTSPRLMWDLETFAVGLYDWVEPDLPEDLGFRRSDGSVLLASIAHEHDAWLELEPNELNVLRDEYKEITRILDPDDLTT